MKALFPFLPQDVEQHVLSFAPDHREKYKRVLDQLQIYWFIRVFKNRLFFEILRLLELELQELAGETDDEEEEE